jgi:hypothetical protein
MGKDICIIDPNKKILPSKVWATNIYGSGFGRSEVLKTIADFNLKKTYT